MKVPREREPGYTIDTFDAPQRAKFVEEYKKQYPPLTGEVANMRFNDSTVYTPPQGFSAHLEHHNNFYKAVRSRQPFFEDGTFGLRTAGTALLTGLSMDEQKVCGWDAEKMERTA